MKKIFTVLTLCLIGQITFAQTNIGGVFLNDTTLTMSGNPYRVINNILIPQGVSVSIGPGVIINFNHGLFWEVDGEIRAIGTSTQPIKFTRHSSATAWAGFWFTDTADDYDSLTGMGCKMAHCIVEYHGNFNLPNTEESYSIKIENCSPLIDNCEVRNFRHGITLKRSNSSVINCIIHDGQYFPLSVFNYDLSPYFANINHNIVYNTGYGTNNSSITLWGAARFRGNCIYDIVDTMAVRIASNNVEIDSNNFSNCQIALGVYGGYDSTLRITNNTFYNNSVNLQLTACERAPVISQNNFSNYLQYHIYVDGYYNLSFWFDCTVIPTSYIMDLQNNYWGGLTSSQMDIAIWDYNDDFVTKVIADYSTPSMVPFNLPPQQGCGGLISVQEHEPALSFSSYPNPAKDNVIISFNLIEQGIVNIELINLYGQTLDVQRFLSVPIGKQEIKFSLKDFSQGIYFVKLSINGVEKVKKILKE